MNVILLFENEKIKTKFSPIDAIVYNTVGRYNNILYDVPILLAYIHRYILYIYIGILAYIKYPLSDADFVNRRI